jgi:hypothetical protein
LHPTFSKVHIYYFLEKPYAKVTLVQQIHKIPGTTYAQANLSPSWDETGGISGGSVGGASTAGDATFKAKMESLHDPTSTNLYMEGSVSASNT